MADERDRAELGEQMSARNSEDRNESLEDARTARSRDVDSEGQRTNFEGRERMESDTGEHKGFVWERNQEDLQEDDAMSGSQGRHGTNGNKQGARRIKRTPSEHGRSTPNQREQDEAVDRTVM